MNKNALTELEIRKVVSEYNKQERRRLFKIFCWFAMVGMPAGISLDMQVYPAYAPYFLKLRLLASLLVAILFFIFYRPWAARFDRVLFLITVMVPQGFITWMIYATEGAVSPYYAGLNVVLVAFCLLLSWTYQETLIFTLMTITGYVIACLAHGPIQNVGIFFNNSYFLFLTGTFAVVGSYFTNKLRTREIVLRYELDHNRKELEESNRKLVELDQMKSRFFANISHELRTPLTLLVAPLQSLRHQKKHLLDEESRDILETMENNAMRLLKLINDLLDLAKLESGRMESHKEPVDLEPFIKGLVQSIQNTARDKRVILSSRVHPSLETVMLDRNKMEKIILNLLFNALKFTPASGRVEMTLEKENLQLVLRIKDTGMGISDQDLPFIFDRFWQADSSAQRKYQGTGIGLALVKELTEAQGGTVTTESKLGAGTTMTVRIPFEEAKDSQALTERSKTSVGNESIEPEEAKTLENEEWLTKLYRRAELFTTLTPLSRTIRSDSYESGKKQKVLVADDEPDMLRFLKSQLEKHYEIFEAVDGNQAVEKARQFLPDLILLDMMMPEKDGIQACKELKGNLSTQSIPVVLLTARADEETKLSALNAGANDFLTKPFSTTELHVRIKNLVNSHYLQSELARQNKRLEAAMEQIADTEATLVQTEKMSSLGRMSAGMIHEINNPLNYALAALSVLKNMRENWPETERSKLDDLLTDMQEGMTRVQRIVTDLRGFTHPHGRGADLIELEEVISIALRFLAHEIGNTVQVDVNLPEKQQIFGEKNNLTHVFTNLFQNALDALKIKKFDGEKPLLSIRGEANGEKMKVWVRDNGSGIAPQYLDKIFDPFFTTKDVGEGMGLGLSICYRIMEEQGGKISVKSEPNKFTEFLLEFPLKIN